MPKISYDAIRRKAVINLSEKFVDLVQGEIIRNISDATIYTLHSIISAFQSYTPHTTTCFNSKNKSNSELNNTDNESAFIFSDVLSSCSGGVLLIHA